MKRILTLFIILTLIVLSNNKLFSQIGGNGIYEFLNLTNSARIASVGGNFLPVKDNDITLSLANPSIISAEMNNQLALSFVDYYSDINYGFAMYSRTFEKFGSFTGTMQYINYGKFDYTDIAGQKQGTFKAAEYAFNIGWGRQLDSTFSIGANFKTIYSVLESYKSFGMAVDIAGTYFNEKHLLTISLIAKNIGLQLKPYYSENTEPLPFELQLGLSKKFKHLPFRYYILLNHLEKWDLTYEDPLNPTDEIDPFTNEVKRKGDFDKFMDKSMRHVVIGGELIFTKNFSVRLGYNYQRRKEMKVDSKLSTVGFSWGFGLKISKFRFSYARSRYHLIGSPNYITITTNLSDFYSKR
ncbi:MAG: type IX secretion system protein PorQ [Bacteroidales bacterium]|nr:type IX secretion system protein PorQ [Bacteroidales bacterium]